MLTLFVASVACEQVSAAANQPRFALVVGNSACASSPLQNPVNDADDVAAAPSPVHPERTAAQKSTLTSARNGLPRYTKVIPLPAPCSFALILQWRWQPDEPSPIFALDRQK